MSLEGFLAESTLFILDKLFLICYLVWVIELSALHERAKPPNLLFFKGAGIFRYCVPLCSLLFHFSPGRRLPNISKPFLTSNKIIWTEQVAIRIFLAGFIFWMLMRRVSVLVYLTSSLFQIISCHTAHHCYRLCLVEKPARKHIPISGFF